MTTAATISARLILDSSDYDKGLGNAEKKANTFSKNFSNSMKSAGGNMMRFGAIATTGVTLPVIGMGVAMLNAASDIEESTNAVNVVFEDSSDIIHEWGKNAVEQAGLSLAEYNQLSAVTGAFLTNLGFNQDEAAKKTIELTKRSADMASVFNTDVAVALEAIQSGLKGEFNPLERFGVKMNMATINAKALEMGLVDVEVDMLKVREATFKLEDAQAKAAEVMKKYGETSEEYERAAFGVDKAQAALEKTMEGSSGEITANMQAQAALALIMEQTDKLAGDFVNTGESFSNEIKKMKAELIDMSGALGIELMPLIKELFPLIKEGIQWFKELNPEQRKWILILLAIAAILPPIIIVIGALVTGIGAIVGVIGAITAPILLVILIIAALIGSIVVLYLAWKQNWFGIRDFLEPIWKKIVSIVSAGWRAFIAFFTSGWRAFITFFTTGWKALIASFKLGWNNLKSIIHTIVEGIISRFMDINWSEIGSNIIQGIADGISAGIQIIIDVAKAAAKAALDAAKEFLGIKSPSKLFEMQVGQPMAEGAARGFMGGMLDLFKMPNVTGYGGFANGLNPSGMRPAATAGGNGLSITNYGTVNLNLKEKNPVDLQRQARLI